MTEFQTKPIDILRNLNANGGLDFEGFVRLQNWEAAKKTFDLIKNWKP